MNHNFLPFEVTELLPKENPYCKITGYYNNRYFKVNKSKLWTIIDALTWLEEQGYVITVEFIEDVWDNNYENKVNCFITFVRNTKTQTLNHINPKIKYNSRIEAYTEGIKHCLNLMKNERTR